MLTYLRPHRESLVRIAATAAAALALASTGIDAQSSGRRYEQFKSAAEYHEFFAKCKAAVQRAEPLLRKYKMPLAIENHKGWRSEELADWVKSVGSEYVGVCLDGFVS